jgi:hypothetical protein
MRPRRQRRLEVRDGEVGGRQLRAKPCEQARRIDGGRLRDAAPEHHVTGEHQAHRPGGGSGLRAAASEHARDGAERDDGREAADGHRRFKRP